MNPDVPGFLGPVKIRGQLAQLSSLALALGSAVTLAATSLTLLVMGHPQQAFTCLREALSDRRHW